MIHVSCPRCQRHLLVGIRDLGQLVTCDKPRCGMVFKALLPPRKQIPTPPPILRRPGLPTELLLTNPHLCPTCKGELSTPVGFRRAAVVHRRMGAAEADSCRMDVFAAIYLCPGCQPRKLLETPSYQCGKEVVCPGCRLAFTAPLFNLIHELVGDYREGEVMRFECPACNGHLQCDTRREGKATAGLPVVCLHCLELISVPPYGERV